MGKVKKKRKGHGRHCKSPGRHCKRPKLFFSLARLSVSRDFHKDAKRVKLTRTHTFSILREKKQAHTTTTATNLGEEARASKEKTRTSEFRRHGEPRNPVSERLLVPLQCCPKLSNDSHAAEVVISFLKSQRPTSRNMTRRLEFLISRKRVEK